MQVHTKEDSRKTVASKRTVSTLQMLWNDKSYIFKCCRIGNAGERYIARLNYFRWSVALLCPIFHTLTTLTQIHSVGKAVMFFSKATESKLHNH